MFCHMGPALMDWESRSAGMQNLAGRKQQDVGKAADLLKVRLW